MAQSERENGERLSDFHYSTAANTFVAPNGPASIWS